MCPLSIIIPVYNNLPMLRRHVAEWVKCDEATLSKVEFVIIDDCSDIPITRANIGAEALDNLRIFRITTDKQWNVPGAKNLGAFMARHKWLFMLDVDHIARSESITEIVNYPESDTFFMLARRDPFDGTPYKKKYTRAGNIFVMRRKHFWDAGGFDEDFVGQRGFEDLLFLDMVQARRIPVKKVDIWLDVYLGKETPDMDRSSKGRQRNEKIYQQKKAMKNYEPQNHMRFDWIKEC